MKDGLLPLPDYVGELIELPLIKLGLAPISVEHDMVRCEIRYGNGTRLTLVLMCVAQAKFVFFTSRKLLISFATLGANGRLDTMYYKDTMGLPTRPNDLEFSLQLSFKIRAMAWTIASLGELGECISLPGRPAI